MKQESNMEKLTASYIKVSPGISLHFYALRLLHWKLLYSGKQSEKIKLFWETVREDLKKKASLLSPVAVFESDDERADPS